MADQGQWFKLWCSADDDPDLSALPLEDFARWVKLGMYIKRHGERGMVSFKKNASILRDKFRVSCDDDVISVLERLPNLGVQKRDGVLTVTFRNWHKYQVDSSAERMRKLRSGVTPKKRREEKRKEEKRKPPTPTPSAAYADAWMQEPWPSVRKFVALYNTEGPDEWPSVEMISSEREKRIREYLTKFPEQNFWLTVFQQAKRSAFCRNYQNGGMDWLLQRGKNDSVENCLKVFEGKYADTPGQRTR